jgi:hypothetical protein
MDNREYFKEWIQNGYVVNLQSIIRIYIICLLAILVIVCIDFIFLVWRYNRGDLADQNLRDIIGNEDDDKNSDEELHKDDKYRDK